MKNILNFSITQDTCFEKEGSTFTKVLETEKAIYFVDQSESDDNANTIMFDLSGELISDNYFANQSLIEDICENRALKIDSSFIYSYNEIIKNSKEEKPFGIVEQYEELLNLIEKFGYSREKISIDQLASIKHSFMDVLTENNLERKYHSSPK